MNVIAEVADSALEGQSAPIHNISFVRCTVPNLPRCT